MDEAEYSHSTPAAGNDNNLTKNYSPFIVQRLERERAPGPGEISRSQIDSTVNKWPGRQLLNVQIV